MKKYSARFYKGVVFRETGKLDVVHLLSVLPPAHPDGVTAEVPGSPKFEFRAKEGYGVEYLKDTFGADLPVDLVTLPDNQVMSL